MHAFEPNVRANREFPNLPAFKYVVEVILVLCIIKVDLSILWSCSRFGVQVEQKLDEVFASDDTKTRII